jgi:uncharacterized lipoprotein YbaY
LTSGARAVVVIVAGTGTATSSTIIGTQVIDKPGQKPISFSVSYKTADIDPKLIYTIQAELEDGERVWTTAAGVKVITKGNPTSDVAVKVTYRADLSTGEVSGSITGVGIELALGSSATAVLIRIDTGETIGVDTVTAPTTVPIPFAIAFDPAAIDPNADYVVRAQIVSGERTWTDAGH